MTRFSGTTNKLFLYLLWARNFKSIFRIKSILIVFSLFLSFFPLSLQAEALAPGAITWTNATLGNATGINTGSGCSNWASVAFGGSKFVAVANGVACAGSQVMVGSADGKTWNTPTGTQSTNWTIPWTGITYGNGLFIAVGTSCTTSCIMTSPDGDSWTAQTNPSISGLNGITYGVVSGTPTFVATTTSNSVLTSSDGVNWSAVTSPASTTIWSKVTFGNNLFVAVGKNCTTTCVKVSPDGITWTLRTTPSISLSSTIGWTAVTFGNSLFVAVANTTSGTNFVMTSLDGTTWSFASGASTARCTTKSSGVANAKWMGITFSNNLFVAVANNSSLCASPSLSSRVMSSSDGINWSLNAYQFEDSWTAVVGNGDTFVAVGEAGIGTQVMYGSIANGVTYDTQGGSLVAAASWSTGTQLTLPAAPTRTGYVFNGWYDAASGGAKVGDGGAVYTPTNTAGFTLYAQWTAITYSITYNSNSPTTGTVPANGSYTYGGVAYTIATNSGTLARTGFTFSGWNTAANGSGTTYAVSTSYSSAGSLTLFAQWESVITYDSNGGTGTASPASTTTHRVDAGTTLAAVGTLARTGYTLTGWNTAADGLGTTYALGLATYQSTGSRTLYAQWQTISSFNSKLLVDLKAQSRGSYPGTGTTWTDLSGSGNNATLVNSPTWASGQFSLSTASANYFRLPSGLADFTSGLTISVRANFGNAGSWERLVDFSNGSASNNILLARNGTSTDLTFEIYNSSIGGSTKCTAPGQITNNGWATYSVTVNGTTCTIYKNGSSVYSLAYTLLPLNITRTVNYIGKSPWGDSAFDSGISAVAVFGRALSAAEISYLAAEQSATEPSAPTIGTVVAIDSNTISVPYTAGSSNGSAITSYTVTSSPSVGLTLTSSATANPLTYTGNFIQGQAYTFTITATNNIGSSVSSSSSNSITPFLNTQTVTWAPTTSLLTTDSPATPSVLATALGSASITYSVVSAGTTGCTVNSSSGILTFTAAGSCTVRATAEATSSYAGATADVVFAITQAIRSITVTQVTNGTISPSTLSKNYGSTQLFTFAPDVGYSVGSITIDGVALTGSALTNAISSGYTFTNIVVNHTVTATWVATTRSITYVLAGGEGALPTQASIVPGATFTTAATPLRAGYTFTGWSDGTTTTAAATSYTMGAVNITLTATWSATSQSITYALAGGTSALPTQNAVATAATFTTAATPLRAGYTFTGWSDGATSTAAATSYTMGTANITLTATWSATSQSITYALAGGTSALPTQNAVATAATFTTAATPSRAGYTFTGWSDGVTSTAAATSYTMGTANITLTATWSATSQSITYALAGGTSALPTQTAVATAATFNTAATPLRAGYTFTGWSDGVTSTAAATSYTMGTANITLAATWIQTSLYGIAPADLTFAGDIRASDTQTRTLLVETELSSVSVRVPSGALPEGTIVEVYSMSNSTYSRSKVLSAGDYIVNLVVAWHTPDGAVPTAITGISVTIRNSLIKAGAKVYGILGDVVTFLGTAEIDGQVVVFITEDPIITVTNLVVAPPTTGGGGGFTPVVTRPQTPRINEEAKKLDEAKTEATQIAEEAKTKADKIVEDAKDAVKVIAETQSKKILDEAKTQATKILEEANAQANEVLAKIKAANEATPKPTPSKTVTPKPTPSKTVTPKPTTAKKITPKPAEKLTVKTQPTAKASTQITCVKGALQRKITGDKPVCPSGFKKK